MLIQSKLVVPRLRGPTVSRPRLHQRLDATATAAVTLVSAPSGYGKTVAVASWLRDRDVPAAWVTVDDHDNDPVRLWTYVAAALGLDLPHPGLEPVAAALSADRRRVILVLDDLEALTDLDPIARAIEALPPNVRLILIDRTVPALPLPRLRGTRRLAELRAEDLAFTVDEAEELLRRAEGLRLDRPALKALVARTEGWVAALHLAALRHRTDGTALGGLSGRHRFMAQYLASEVLDRLDRALRDFVTETSVLPRFSADLADATRGRDDSADLLRRAAAENLFLVTLDEAGEWFRYHALFAEYLRGRVDQPDPLRRRAGAWFRAHDLIEEAVELFGAAHDAGSVAAVLEAHHLELARAGRGATIERWIAVLPRELLTARPGVIAAAVLAASGSAIDREEAKRLLALAGLAQQADPERWTAYHEVARLLLSALHGDHCVPAAAAAAEEALRLAPGTPLLVPAMTVRAYTLVLQGETAEADRVAADALCHPDANQTPYARIGARTVRALTAALDDRPTLAEAHADRALREASRAHLRHNLITALAHFAAALAALRHGDPAAAERRLRKALALRPTFAGGALDAWVTLTLADVHAARGRLGQAERTLREAHELLAACLDAGRVTADPNRFDAPGRADGPPREALSKAELAVLGRFGEDRSTAQIAADLYLSRNTVKTHIRAIYRKLGVASRADALATAETLSLLVSPG